jgi:putative ABC transport system substrate-binding protein
METREREAIGRTRRAIGGVVVLVLLTGLTPPAGAASDPPRLGVLMMARSVGTVEPFVDGLRALGHVDGRTVVIQWKSDNARGERLPELAAELVRAKVAVIYALGPEARAAARKATATIPIVAIAGADPVAEGFAESLARPGGNVTGLTATYPDLPGKQLELMKEMVPELTRVGTIWDATAFGAAAAPENRRFVEPMTSGARALGLDLRFIEVRVPGDFERVLQAARRDGAQALRVGETSMIHAHRAELAKAAIEARVPLFGQFRESGEAGYLAAYGVNLDVLHRRAAGYVDRILKGAAPGTLPIERPSALELVVNLKTARALGLAIPRAVLTRADRRIE